MLMRADIIADALDENINKRQKRKKLFIFHQKVKNLIRVLAKKLK